MLTRLLNEGWFPDEKQAAAWVMERKVLVNEQPAFSVKELVKPDSVIRVKEYYKIKYVNKGGYKLEGAFSAFNLSAEGKTALDCGASTGGFTDCLLQHGAAHVYAVDVGHGQLAGKLASSPRVTNMERTNLSDGCLLALSPRPELITLDLSYLSLKKAVPVCKSILHGKGYIVALIKPLFEVDSSELRRTGKMEDPQALCRILQDICGFCRQEGFDVLGITHSPIRGNNGTVEYFIYLACGMDNPAKQENFEDTIPAVVAHSLALEHFNKG